MKQRANLLIVVVVRKQNFSPGVQLNSIHGETTQCHDLSIPDPPQRHPQQALAGPVHWSAMVGHFHRIQILITAVTFCMRTSCFLSTSTRALMRVQQQQHIRTARVRGIKRIFIN